MTQHDAEEYAKALKEYEEEQKHIYFVSHHDKTITGFFKDNLSEMGILIVSMGVFFLLFGGVMGLIDGNMAHGFKTAFVLIGIPILSACPYYYLFYMNDVKRDFESLIFSGIANVIIWLVASNVFHVTNVYALIAIYIVTIYVVMRFQKTYFSAIPKPKASDFDSEMEHIDISSYN